MRILLVEDNADLRRMFARLLAGRGFDVRSAVDGVEALAILDDFVPEVIVTDLMMPRMDGLELARQVRSMPSLAAVPIVVLTAALTESMAGALVEAGVAALLDKPVDVWDLSRRIGALRA